MEPFKNVHEPLYLPVLEAVLPRRMLITIESQLQEFSNFTTAADPIDDVIVVVMPNSLLCYQQGMK